MLEMYRVRVKTYKGNVLVGNVCLNNIIREDNPVDEEIKLTWKNLEDIYYDYGFFLPFSIWNFKKGRRIELYQWNPFKKEFRALHEWKHNDIDITVKIKHELVPVNKVSLNDLKEYEDCVMAIQYMKEKNLI